MEGSRHFDEKSAVFHALRGITRRLDLLGVPYAIVGGMALFHDGLRRFTEDVDILVRRNDLRRIHSELDGRGYVPPHRHSKNLRDTAHNVRIKFLLTGEFPGDGKPKPVAFPDPDRTTVETDSIKYINLAGLIELKLASGMTQPDRIRDIGDVQQLIQVLHLGEDYASRLDPYVRDKYLELCRHGKKRYVTLWRKSLAAGPSAAGAEQDAKSALNAMLADGVKVEATRTISEDYSYLVTTDPAIARKYDMVDETEFWPEGS